MKFQSGMSLIEVMVAVMILGSGLLGLGALQARAIAMSQSSQYRSIAADLAADLADRIRANRTPYFVMEDSALQASFAARLPPDFAKCPQNATPSSAPVCSAQSAGHQSYLVQTEMTEWNQALRAQLPNATYTLVSTAASASATNPLSGFYRYTLTITWKDDRTSSSASNFSYTTVIE